MRYMGSKSKYAKELLPIILKSRMEDQWYVEPFVGGFHMIDKVQGNRLANDSNYYLIELFKAVQSGWQPPEIVSEELYSSIRHNPNCYSPCLIGFVGFGCSYSGKWFGEYARSNDDRNYCRESRNNLLKQVKGLQDIVIENKDYAELYIPPTSIIYCDPPYEGTTSYKDKFDHNRFWDWCRTCFNSGHKVFVSEYNAPDDFACVWAKKVNNTLVRNTGSKQGVEKLFTLY